MNKYITLSQGNGGRQMRELIEGLFVKYLANDILNTRSDAAELPMTANNVMTTVDGFTVQPVIFPGGDIGSLCIHGTVNDLAVSGASAKYITLALIIEEGMAIEKLENIVRSIADTARACDVQVVCGDTKVVPRGQGGEIYITTTGIGVRTAQVKYDIGLIRPGDKIIMSGTIGDHGAAVMLAREEFGLSANIHSDSACVMPLCELLNEVKGVRFMRDPTRGGIATVLHEITNATGFGIDIVEAELPVTDEVKTVCEMLGYDYYYLANEGRVVAIVDASVAETVVNKWKNNDLGECAKIIGQITETHAFVIMKTELGGEKIINELTTDPLPRIC